MPPFTEASTWRFEDDFDNQLPSVLVFGLKNVDIGGLRILLRHVQEAQDTIPARKSTRGYHLAALHMLHAK